MDDLLGAIHSDLKALRPSSAWLADYGDRALSEDSIFFSPNLPEREGPIPQQPDQLFIRYERDEGCPVNEIWLVDPRDEQVCRFPKLGYRLLVHLPIRRDEKLLERIRSAIITRCRALQDELKGAE